MKARVFLEFVCPACEGRGKLFRPIDGALLAVIFTAVGEQEFAVHDLVAHAEFNDTLAEVLAVLRTKRLGKFLQRITGQELDGLRVERIGENEDGAILKILRVVHSHEDAG